MSGDICKSDDQAPIFELRPVKIIAASSVGRSVPTGNFVSLDVGPDLWQQRLLDGADDSEAVLHLFEHALGFSFVQCCLYMFSNFPGNEGSDTSCSADHDCEERHGGVGDRIASQVRFDMPADVMGRQQVPKRPGHSPETMKIEPKIRRRSVRRSACLKATETNLGGHGSRLSLAVAAYDALLDR